MHGEETEARRYVVLVIDDLRLAVPLDAVDRVVHAVEITPVAELAPPLAGCVNLHGERVAVLDLRRRLGLPARELRLSDRMVLVRRGAQRWFLLVDAALVVDAATADAALPAGGADAAPPPDVAAPVAECCPSRVRLEIGRVGLIDVGRLLSAAQLGGIGRALAGEEKR